MESRDQHIFSKLIEEIHLGNNSTPILNHRVPQPELDISPERARYPERQRIP
jgi:hypothetical protein